MRRRILVVVLFAALAANATSLRNWERGDLVANPRYASRNGRYVLVVRRHLIRDFASVPVETLVDFDAEGWSFPDARRPRPVDPSRLSV